MTTLETKAGTKSTDTFDEQTTQSAPVEPVEQATETAALITEQQVMFASAAALAPAPAIAPAKHHRFVSAIHAMLTWEPKPRARKDYPQRFAYLENSAMSREMDRL